MANSALDARASEQELRQKLIESHAVEVIVAVGPNMFYTVTLPCTLCFFDEGKVNTPRADIVFFIDARLICWHVDRAHREWGPAQSASSPISSASIAAKNPTSPSAEKKPRQSRWLWR